MDMSKYKAMFVSEAREQLAQMDVAASQLQRTPTNKELVDQLFRSAHSLKGMAASMEYEEIATLAHALEDVLSDFRAGAKAPDKALLELLMEGVDVLSGQVDARAESGAPRDAFDLAGKIRSFLKDAGAGASADPPPVPVAPDDPPGNEAGVPQVGMLVSYRLSVSGTMGGLKGFLAFKRLSTLGAAELIAPDLVSLKKGEFVGPVQVRLPGFTDEEVVAKVLGAIAEVESFQVSELIVEPTSASQKETFRGEGAGRVESTVRVRTSFLDYFINAVGELAAVRSRLEDLAQVREDEALSEITSRLEAQIRELYAQVMSVRLMPLESVTSILPRTVREIARKRGREVNFEMQGQDLEVDRSILEVVLDPLIHILRNAVDHGIELPEEREKSGKPRLGQIRLLAYREREKTVIQVSDDGRGLDPAKLRRKAVSKGLISTEAAEMLNDHDALQLVCLPGFSTAEEVTETSGRGVGMDAVKAAMDRVGGDLVLESVTGRGTTFQLVLPRSVAIVPVMLAGAGGEVFAFPLSRISRTLIVEPEDIRKSRGRRFCVVDDQSVSVINLARAVGLKIGGEARPNRRIGEEDLIRLILVERQGGLLAVEVDRFVGHQEAFIKPVGKPLERIPCLGGATVLGSGRPVFVIEAAALDPAFGYGAA